MANRLFIPTAGASDWRRLLAAPDKHWRPGYSAMSAALSWERSTGLPAPIDTVFEAAGLGSTELLLAVPEWKTPLPGGRRESQTDIFALVRTAKGVFATGVEAKVAESFGPTIGEWMKEASPGKQERIAAICTLLGLSCPPAPDLRYQLFHRTAAAVLEARRFGAAGAAMIVQSFSETRQWLEDWQALVRLFGVEASPAAPALVTLADGSPLLLGWACSPPITDIEETGLKYLHTMVRVSDLDASLKFYALLGLNEVRRAENEKGRFTLVFLAGDDDRARSAAEHAPEVELTYNWDPEDYSGGRNFGHMAFAVDDIYAACARLRDGGVTINRPPRDGHMAFVRSPDGISIELLQKNGSLPPTEPWASMPNTGVW